MDPKGKGVVVNDKEESLFNEPRDDKPTDSVSSHKKKDGKRITHFGVIKCVVIYFLSILAFGKSWRMECILIVWIIL
jgi:hypothetical protein